MGKSHEATRWSSHLVTTPEAQPGAPRHTLTRYRRPVNRLNRFCTMWRETGCLGQTEGVERGT